MPGLDAEPSGLNAHVLDPPEHRLQLAPSNGARTASVLREAIGQDEKQASTLPTL